MPNLSWSYTCCVPGRCSHTTVPLSFFVIQARNDMPARRHRDRPCFRTVAAPSRSLYPTGDILQFPEDLTSLPYKAVHRLLLLIRSLPFESFAPPWSSSLPQQDVKHVCTTSLEVQHRAQHLPSLLWGLCPPPHDASRINFLCLRFTFVLSLFTHIKAQLQEGCNSELTQPVIVLPRSTAGTRSSPTVKLKMFPLSNRLHKMCIFNVYRQHTSHAVAQFAFHKEIYNSCHQLLYIHHPALLHETHIPDGLTTHIPAYSAGVTIYLSSTARDVDLHAHANN